MGKTADNERIKLRATYYNNISVGVAVAGVLVPCLVLYNQQIDVSSQQGLVAFTTILVALVGALLLRRAADHEIRQIED